MMRPLVDELEEHLKFRCQWWITSSWPSKLSYTHEEGQPNQAQEPTSPSASELVEQMRAAMRRYLPPDSGITAEQFASEIIGILDRKDG